MKLTIEKDQLLNGLTVVAKGMASRTTVPILAGVLLEARQAELVMQTTDLMLSIKHEVAALIEQTGATVVPGKLFTDIIKSLPAGAVSLSLDNDELSIVCQESRFTVHTLSADDFPAFPQVEESAKATLPAEVFAAMVRKVSKAVSKDESRAVLTGVLVKIEATVIELVATDSYRLAIAKHTLNEDTASNLQLIIPGDVLDEISRLVAHSESISVADSENQIVFSFGSTKFVTRKIEGNYPNYQAIIPTEKTCTAITETAALLAAVRRASITAQAHSPLSFNINQDIQTIDISSSTQDVASAREKVSAQIEGEGMEIGFNHQYIIDGLSSVDSEEISFETQSALKPGIFRTVGDDSFFYLTMPVRLER